MSTVLVPQQSIPEAAIVLAVKNIVEGIAELLEEETATVLGEWVEAAGIENHNAFMRDKVLQVLSARLLDFTDCQPQAHQWTSEHVQATVTPLLPPPSNPKPEPLDQK
jgi:phosphoribosylamine-glycine ligase